MVLKRPFSEEEGLGLEEAPSVQESRRRLTLENVEEVRPVLESRRRVTLESVGRNVMNELSAQELISSLEPLFRRVVREEVERAIPSYLHLFPRPLPNRIEAARSRSWKLHFTKSLPGILFTNSKIEAEGNTAVQVVIIDANSKIVTSGSLSSVKVEILVLDGDFGSDGKEDWTEEEFDASLIREREGKRPLVVGELQITLKDGVGYFADVTFTDNSSWTRSRKFRLGARVVKGTCNEERIREARTEGFTVKDHRGELYKKNHPPSWSDEVWRLEKIGKEGAFHNRLSSHGIKTVQDLLRLLTIDEPTLRNIFGNTMSTRVWEIIVQHASNCTLANKKYRYYSAEKQFGILFDSIYRVIGVTFDCQRYHSLDILTSQQMILMENLKQQAYRSLSDMVEVDCSSVDAPPMALPLLGASFPGSHLDVQLTDLPITHQDQPAIEAGPHIPTNVLQYDLDNHEHLPDVSDMQGYQPVQPFAPIQRNDFKMKNSLTTYNNDGNQWVEGESSGSVMLDRHFCGNEIPQVQTANWSPFPQAFWGHGNECSLTSGDETGFGFLSALPELSSCMTRNHKTKWFKLRAALKWGISVRRDLAARRRERFWQLNY